MQKRVEQEKSSCHAGSKLTFCKDDQSLRLSNDFVYLITEIFFLILKL